MRRDRKKRRVKIRIPISPKPNQVIRNEVDKNEFEESRKTSSQYIKEFIEEIDEGEDDDEE